MMEERIRKILEDVQSGKASSDKAMEELRYLPFLDMGDIKIDSHRRMRTGIPEAIFAPGKSKEQIVNVVKEMRGKDMIFITKADADVYKAVKNFGDATYYEKCKIIVIGKRKKIEKERNEGYIVVASAGTGDIPVAEEAAVTAEALGSRVERIYDVGAAGIHRLLEFKNTLFNATVIVATAGMDGVLPGIISSLFPVPVVALPTSVGYGTGIRGFAALLTMLNSCSPGMAVVNIDNGFGAGVFAHKINEKKNGK
ncbi:MAG: nickel pincer cofactor biosynthesis protein LarB [Candidatus Thermoplasmatota archaeon]|nr:nickel pincer cofactor biosynthesis protein LarB [Candidatus Thermoplasmatota archaeon]